MPRHWCGLLVVGLLLSFGLTGRADEQEEGLKLANAAIKAAGGEAKLDKLKIVSMKGKGTVSEGDQDATFTIEGTVQGLDRFRLDLEMSFGGRTEKVLIVFNGDKGWAKTPDKVEDAPPDAIPLIQAELHALRMAQMLTSLKDKAVKLSPLGEVKVNDRAANGLKFVQKDRPDVDLFFDKETHLPIKCQMRVKEREGEMTHEWFFSDYKELGGAKHPTKIALHRDSKKLMEMEITEVKPEEKLDESTFAKP
jgi:hypothetical protein